MTGYLASSGGAKVLAVPLDEFVIGTLAFLIVLFVLGKFALPKIKTVLEEREEAIVGGINRAREAEEAAEQLRQSYRAELERARQEAAQIRSAAQADRAETIEEARREAQEAAREVTANAQAHIDAERLRAASELRHDVGTLATDLAEKIVGEALRDDARASAVIDRFIADLETAAADVRQA